MDGADPAERPPVALDEHLPATPKTEPGPAGQTPGAPPIEPGPAGHPPAYLLMGVLNATPDSFSDGGRFAGPEQAVAAGLEMVAAGATILDVGGESTRPGAARVPAEEQERRVVPVIRGLRDALAGVGGVGSAAVTLSVDTTRAAVASAAADAGATLLNDVSAGTDDPDLFGVAGERGLPVVLMHKRGEPATMQARPVYGDVVAEVTAHLRERSAAAEAAGVPGVWLDPGIGFGKTLEHNLALLRALPTLVGLGPPVLLGASRKSFLARLDPGAEEAGGRLPGSLSAAVLGLAAGVRTFRVHDVAAHRQALATAAAILPQTNQTNFENFPT